MASVGWAPSVRSPSGRISVEEGQFVPEDDELELEGAPSRLASSAPSMSASLMADVDVPVLEASGASMGYTLVDIDAPVLGRTRTEAEGYDNPYGNAYGNSVRGYADATEAEMEADANNALEEDGWFFEGADEEEGEEGEGGGEEGGVDDASFMEALQASVRATGTLTSVKTRAERKAQKAYAAAHRKTFELRTALLRAEIEVADAGLSRAQASERLVQLRAQAAEDAAKLAAVVAEGANRPTRNLQATLAARASESAASVVKMQVVEEGEGERQLRAQNALDAVDVALVRAEIAEQPLARNFAPISARDHAVASLRAESERAEAQRQERKKLQNDAMAEAEAMLKSANDQRFVERSAALVQATRERLAETQRAMAVKQKELAGREVEEQRRRAKAVIALKKSREGITAKLHAANARMAAKRASEALALKEESKRILAAGGNPHEVSRRRTETARLDGERTAAQAKLRRHADALAARILAEESRYQAQRRKALRAKAAEKMYLEDFSTVARETRADAFMAAHTLGGQTLIDPTSRMAKLYASDHAAVKTRAFGSSLPQPFGANETAADAVLAREALKFPDVTFDNNFVPRGGATEEGQEGTYPEGGVPGSAGGTVGASGDGGRRGKGGLQPVTLPSAAAAAREAKLFGSLVDEMVAPATPGLWDEGGAGGDGDEISSPAKANAFGVRTLSKLEQQYMAAARERQKTAMLKPQVVGGKLFTGTAFVPNPGVIEFKDFEVGCTYSKTVTLTNVSRTFNTFRVQPLPDAMIDFFSVAYAKPGYLSAGTTAKVTVTFTPRVEGDIITSLPLLCETGPESVPIRCLRRKADVRVWEGLLDFGQVVLGESKTLYIEVSNEGYIGVSGSVEAGEEVTEEMEQGGMGGMIISPTEESLEAIGEPGGGELIDGPFGYESMPSQLRAVMEKVAPDMVVARREVFSCATVLSVPGYKKVKMAVTFRPLKSTTSTQLITLSFGGVPGAPNAAVVLRGAGARVPVFAAREVVDLKALLIGSVYRDEVVVGNRGSSSFKIEMLLPQALRDVAAFTPTVAFVQANSTATVSLRIQPEADLLRRCAEVEDASVDVDSGVVQIPMTIRVASQTLPTLWLLRLQLTNPELSLSPSHIDFGHCAVGESVGQRIRITNRSTLKVDFGFGPLPPELDVQPGDALGSLLPFETVERVVRFSPRAATPFRHALHVSTSQNKSFQLPCVGAGSEASLILSASSVRFPATPFGGKSSTSIEVKSALRYGAHFELRPVKEGAPFRASPTVLWLEAGEAARVQLLFEPKRANSKDGARLKEGALLKEGAAAAQGSAVTRALKKGADATGGAETHLTVGGGESLGPTRPVFAATSVAAASRVRGSALSLAAQAVEESVLIAVYVQTAAAAAASHPSKGGSAAAQGDQAQHAPALTQYIRAEGAALPAVVVWESTGEVEVEAQFGVVSVGQAVPRRLRLLNLSDETVHLSISEPDPTGPFSLLNAVRALPPHGELQLGVQFAPTQEANSFQQLVIGCARGNLLITLAGSGAAPTLKIGLPEPGLFPAAPGTLHLGACLVNDEVSASFSLTNESDFDLPFELVPLRSGHRSERGRVVIEVTPRSAVVKAGAEHTCVATFAPDLAGQAFFCLFELRVPNERDRQTLCVRGHAYASAAWLLAPSVLAAELASPTPDGSGLPLQQLLLQPDGRKATGALDEIAAKVIELTLEPDARHAGTAELLLGNVPPRRLAADAKPTPVEFTVGALSADAVALGFKVETSKGSVEQGKAEKVRFFFTPTSKSLAQSNLGIISSFGVSQWTEVSVSLSLKGGSPPPEHAELTVVLRGFIPTAEALAEAAAIEAARKAKEAMAAGAAKGGKATPPKKK